MSESTTPASQKAGTSENSETLPIPRSRHWILALLLQLGIRIRYLFQNFFGLKALFSPLSAYPSPFRPEKCPKYDFVTQQTFLWIWYITAFARDTKVLFIIFIKCGIMTLLSKLHSWASERLMKQFEAAGYTEADREIAVPEYDWKNGSPEEFYKLFVKRPHPVVLRGFMQDRELLAKLNWTSVLERFGEEDVLLTKKELDGFPGKLKDVQDPKIYLHNSEVLFNKYPEIRKLFEYSRLEPFLKMRVGYEQIFVGKQGTGSPFHNASVYNMFYQIDGQKTWWFVDPYDTFLSYPSALMGKAAFVLFCLFPDEYNKEAFPLFKYCPVYKSTLNPGDVLFNPPWWWHSIKNVTPTTVGVASRWHTDGIVGHTLLTSEEDYDIYRFGSLLFQSGMDSWSFLHGILQTPSPRYDEHATLRETKNRFGHKQREVAEKGGIEFLGITTKF